MSGLNSVPTVAHWAILTQTSVTTPGDERSRTHPGHGYPESTETYINYDAYTDEAKWKEQVERLSRSKYGSSFRAIYVQPAQIETVVSVKVKTA